jgi:hypothetical protein
VVPVLRAIPGVPSNGGCLGTLLGLFMGQLLGRGPSNTPRAKGLERFLMGTQAHEGVERFILGYKARQTMERFIVGIALI